MSKKMKMSAEGKLFCIENPLLDISAHVTADFLKKYDLDDNSAILAEKKHEPIYQEIVEKFSVEYIAGGSTQNTSRVAQWMSKEENVVTFVGCVGNDENGKKLEEAAKKAGLRVEYLHDEKVKTGVCAVLITGKHRSMVTDLLAANEYKISHLETPKIWGIVEKAEFFYVGGFFLTVSPPSIQKIAEHAAENDKMFMMNLSAPFISQFFKEPLMKSSPYWDILFGNETEAETFAKEQGFETTDLKEIALKIADLPKINQKRKRVVVITHGAEPTLVATQGEEKGKGTISEFPIIKVKPEEIVDTNGAGDAFVGGFLSQLVLGKSIEECVKGGHFAANIIIKNPGCTFPDQKPDF